MEDATGLALMASILVSAVSLHVGNEWRKDRIRARTEVLWPGGHVVSPVRRLGPGYGYNDPGTYEWRWRCQHCGEEHRTQDRFGEECPL